MMDVLAFLLTEPARAANIDSPRDCFDKLDALEAAWPSNVSSVDRAAAGGFIADRLGYAFLAGYRAALRRLDPSLTRASLCASEVGGAHPRAIETRLERRGEAWALTGEKTFATLASEAETLLVVASTLGTNVPGQVTGEQKAAGRKNLQIARIPAARAGITIRDRDPIAFAPEIPHAVVSLDGVRVEPSEILEGDGYLRVLKPFRTLEDVHVLAAWLGHVARVVRLFGERRELLERCLVCLAALRDLAVRDPLDPVLHVGLAGAFTEATAVVSACTLAAADETTTTRWQRDRPLLGVAEKVRELRRDAAHAFFSRNG